MSVPNHQLDLPMSLIGSEIECRQGHGFMDYLDERDYWICPVEDCPEIYYPFETSDNYDCEVI